MIISCGFCAGRKKDSVVDEITMLMFSFEENIYFHDNQSKFVIVTDEESINFLPNLIKNKDYVIIKIMKYKKIKPTLRKLLLNDIFINYLVKNKIESLYVHTDTVFLDNFYDLYNKHIKNKTSFFYQKVTVKNITKLLQHRPKKHYKSIISQNKHFGLLFFLIINRKVINNKKLQKELFDGVRNLKYLSQYSSIKNMKTSKVFYIESDPHRTKNMSDNNWNKIGLYHYDRLDNNVLNFYHYIPIKYFTKKHTFLDDLKKLKDHM